jgi:hypothetical protein
VATTFSELEARVLGLDARTLRPEEDVTATVIETRDDVRRLEQAVQALLNHAGVEPEPGEGADE